MASVPQPPAGFKIDAAPAPAVKPPPGFALDAAPSGRPTAGAPKPPPGFTVDAAPTGTRARGRGTMADFPSPMALPPTEAETQRRTQLSPTQRASRRPAAEVKPPTLGEIAASTRTAMETNPRLMAEQRAPGLPYTMFTGQLQYGSPDEGKRTPPPHRRPAFMIGRQLEDGTVQYQDQKSGAWRDAQAKDHVAFLDPSGQQLLVFHRKGFKGGLATKISDIAQVMLPGYATSPVGRLPGGASLAQRLEQMAVPIPTKKAPVSTGLEPTHRGLMPVYMERTLGETDFPAGPRSAMNLPEQMQQAPRFADIPPGPTAGTAKPKLPPAHAEAQTKAAEYQRLARLARGKSDPVMAREYDTLAQKWANRAAAIEDQANAAAVRAPGTATPAAAPAGAGQLPAAPAVSSLRSAGRTATPAAAGSQAATDPLAIGAKVSGVSLPRAAAAAETGALMESRVAPEIGRKITDAAGDLLASGKVTRDPNRLLSDQIMELLQTSRLSTPEISAILARHGLKPDQLAELWRVDIRKAARDLQTLAAVERRLQALAGDPAAEAALARVQEAAGLDPGTRAMGFWRRLDGVRRGLLVTQLATAARNFVGQVGRLGLDTLQQGIDDALGRMFGLPGARQVHALSAFESLLNVFRPIRTKAKVDGILSRFPVENDSLFTRYASDLSRRVGGGAMGVAERATSILNVANRFQEFVTRRAVFAASLSRRLERAGIDLDTLIRENRVGEIPRDTIRAAVDDALELTWGKNFSPFAAGAEGKAGKFIDLVSGSPLSLVIPFPRFLMNALRFQYQFSPLGFLRLLSKSERNAIARGDTSAITRATLGTSMLLGAWQLRHSDYAGEKWYEIRLPDGRMIDARAFAPFSSYLFVADVIDPKHRNRLTTNDVAQGVLSANMRAGLGIYAVDQVLDGIVGIGDPEKAKRMLQTGAGEIVAGFATPLMTVKDFVSQFDRAEGVVRSGDEGPFAGINWGPLQRMVPWWSQSLPAVESPTRAADLRRESPMLRQLTGLTMMAPKNAAERELDRLGLKRGDILPGTGDPTADRLLAKYMGPLVEKHIGSFVTSPLYRALPDAARDGAIRGWLTEIRAVVRRAAEAAAPALFARIKQQNRPRWERQFMEELRQRR